MNYALRKKTAPTSALQNSIKSKIPVQKLRRRRMSNCSQKPDPSNQHHRFSYEGWCNKKHVGFGKPKSAELSPNCQLNHFKTRSVLQHYNNVRARNSTFSSIGLRILSLPFPKKIFSSDQCGKKGKWTDSHTLIYWNKKSLTILDRAMNWPVRFEF